MLNCLAVFVRIDALLAMLRYGRGVELRWGNMAGRVVEETLHRYGVPTYDQRVHPRNVRSVRVPASQGRWAEYVLKRRGVPLLTAIDPSNRNVKPGPRMRLEPKALIVSSGELPPRHWPVESPVVSLQP
jgi:hypothetical protein